MAVCVASPVNAAAGSAVAGRLVASVAAGPATKAIDVRQGETAAEAAGRRQRQTLWWQWRWWRRWRRCGRRLEQRGRRRGLRCPVHCLTLQSVEPLAFKPKSAGRDLG
eukprot:4882495-Prymnesium_polylepis.1